VAAITEDTNGIPIIVVKHPDNLLTACDEPLDLDLRGGLGGRLDTADAARTATADRPAPDQRGIISYPGYQVAVARRGDTVASLAARIGGNAEEIARYNGIQTGDRLRKGEIVALPSRVAEPAGGPIQPPEGVDITSPHWPATPSRRPIHSVSKAAPCPRHKPG
jgi:hypothetical protein